MSERVGPRVAIVGATSFRGRELKEVLEARKLPVQKLSLVDDEEAVGQLTEFEGEPTFVDRISAEIFREHDLVFFASTRASFTRAQWPVASQGRATLVDLSHALLEVPEAVVRVPFLDELLPPSTPSPRAWYVVPHAAAIILLALLARLGRVFSLRRAVATVFEPASERGASGLEELKEQTVGLLSFREFPRAVFDAQVAFNLLTRYGAGSQTALEEVENIVWSEVERVAKPLARQLTLRCIQAPVFHSACLSVFVDLEHPVDIPAVKEALAGEPIVVEPEEAAVTAVSVAGRDEILLGGVVRDRTDPAGFWLWAVADNLRLSARTAVDIAERVIP